MLDKLTGDTFAPYLQQSFRMVAEGVDPFEATLVAVDPLGTQRREAPLARPFSVIFEVPNGASLSQGTYRVAHDAVGTYDLFLVPIGVGEGGLRLEAVFT